MSRKERERALERGAAGKSEYPALWDWRNKGGRSFITPPEDQGKCGACVAFATAGAIDAMMRLAVNISTGDPGSSLVPNLSEGQLFYCGGPGDCGNGWSVTPALTHAQESGLVSERSYPYTVSAPGCTLPFVKNWKSLTTRISGWHTLKLDEVGADAMKKWIATTGPLVTTMAVVYEDFWKYYTGGVYKWNGTSPKVTTDGRDMGHALCVIGYDDAQQAWLCKNSCGTGWGMGGYCYIEYGQCGIDAQMWGVNGVSNVYPFFPATGMPSVCIYSGQTHYAYRDTTGNIHDVIWNGSYWSSVQVAGPGGQTEGPAAASDPAVVVYSGTGFNQMHYFYRDANGYIWDAQFTGSGWIAMQVTGPNSLAGGPPAAGDLAAIVYAGQLHCVFHDSLAFNVMDAVCADRWSLQNVTASSKGQVTANTAALVVRSGASYNQMHYCYRDAQGNIWDSQWTGSGWVSTQVTGANGRITSAPAAVGDPAVILYADQNVTSLSGAPAAAGDPTAFVSQRGKLQRVASPGKPSSVHASTPAHAARARRTARGGSGPYPGSERSCGSRTALARPRRGT